MLRGEKENETYPLLKCTKTQSWRQELLNNEWPNMNKKIATRKLLTCNKVTVLRN